MTLNHRMIMKRYPKSNGVLGGVIPGCEIFSQLDGKLARRSHSSCVPKKTMNLATYHPNIGVNQEEGPHKAYKPHRRSHYGKHGPLKYVGKVHSGL